jgi:glutathionylspermidine synthase
MRRVSSFPRLNWREEVEQLGFTYHTIDGDLYWDEAGWYEFTLAEIEELEAATNTLHELSLQAVQVVIEENRFDEFLIPPQFHHWIRDSWNNDDPSIYGRFDLAWDGKSPPRMLEYNADTPTGLFEASVVQWKWLQAVHPGLDQFNSLHERLIAGWKEISRHDSSAARISFATTDDHEEDFGNVSYLRDAASQCGIITEYLDMTAIGYDSSRDVFVNGENNPIEWLFKLYPWEWMLQEEFASHLLTARTRWIEPPWKMLLSNKALLVILWELFPECEYLLPAGWEPLSDEYVRKPLLAREGSNIQIVRNGSVMVQTDGPYADQPAVFQNYYPLSQANGSHAVMGSWIVGGSACGLGIREDRNPITHNLSRFIPHVIRG